MKIYLIGMPGSGKTTLGKKLAKELLMLFIDLDKEIERRERRSISQIFSENGEDYFRKVESRELTEWAGSEKSFVMATGGGTPCFFDGIGVINRTGFSLFLDTPVNTLVSRLEKKSDRPLLQTADVEEKKQKLMHLRDGRLTCYRQANITIENADLSKVMAAIHLRK